MKEIYITNDIKYIGVDDEIIDLFEGQYAVPDGMSYNSYVILDDEIAILDTTDGSFTLPWLSNVRAVLGDKKPAYLIVNHMEPDHSSAVSVFMDQYPEAKVVSTVAAFNMMKNFFGEDYKDRRIAVKDGDTLSLGKHILRFVTAPMVHWPEVMFTYDETDKVLFSADAFGKFGTLEAEKDNDEGWDCEARRYYFNIVGKYGGSVQAVLAKASALDIQIICPLHGPVLSEDLGHYLSQYDIWSKYEVESEGITIAFTSVYGHTKEAALRLATMLKERGCPLVSIFDLARCDKPEALEDAFRYGQLVLATTTYCNGIFPAMKEFIDMLIEHNYQKRLIGIIENGSWAPKAERAIKAMLEGCDVTFTEQSVHIKSAMKEANLLEMAKMADELCRGYSI